MHIHLSSSLYTFPRESILNKYFKKKWVNRKGIFTIENILLDIKKILKSETLFDERNCSIVMCNSELEEVFDMKALHVMQIQDVVLKHIIIKRKLQKKVK